jgi:hypothetical protein
LSFEGGATCRRRGLCKFICHDRTSSCSRVLRDRRHSSRRPPSKRVVMARFVLAIHVVPPGGTRDQPTKDKKSCSRSPFLTAGGVELVFDARPRRWPAQARPGCYWIGAMRADLSIDQMFLDSGASMI